MKLKKLLAAVTAAALAVTTMAVTSFTASAASLPDAPDGTETVLYSVDLSKVKSTFTKKYDNGDWTQIDIAEADRGTIMSDPDVYVKATMSNVGGSGDSSFDTIMSWGWGGYSSWMDGLKWYNNNGDGADFTCNLLPIPTSTADNAIAYAPISDLKMYDWGGIAGNLQCGHFEGLTVNKLEIVRIDSDTTVYVSKTYAPDKTEDGNDGGKNAYFTGAWDLTKAVGSNARVEFTFDGTPTSGFALCDGNVESWWTAQKLVGSASKTSFKISEIEAAGFSDPLKIVVNGWGTSTPTGMIVYNGSSDELYTPAGNTPADPVIDTITLNARVTGLEVGKTLQLTATVKDTEGNTMPDAAVTWTSSDTSIATVSATGLVMGVADGEVTITAAADETHTAECKINVFVMPVIPAIMPANPTIKVGETVQMSVLNAGEKTIEWEIPAEGANIATIDANGLVTGVGVGMTEIRAYLDGEGKDNGTFPYTVITVTAAGTTPVDPTPDDPNPPAHTHTIATTWSSDGTNHWHACSGCDEKLDTAAHTSDGGITTTPATETAAGTKTYKCTVCGYVIKTETIPATGTSDTPAPAPAPAPAPTVPSENHSYTGSVVIPTWIGGGTGSNTPAISGSSGKSGWDAISEEALAVPDGTKIDIDMNGITRVPSSVFKNIKDKDVDLVFNMGRGVKWTVNGLSVTSAKTIDLDFSKNTRHIPDELVDAAEGSYKKQLSLDHNGSFGFTAVMTYDIGSQYNGSYANLFYYNPKSKELELTDCSPISGGKANFVFNHASYYLITVTDEPLGDFEDVSSAAGITSDNGGANSIAFCSVLAVITLAFGFVVYKKRRHN